MRTTKANHRVTLANPLSLRAEARHLGQHVGRNALYQRVVFGDGVIEVGADEPEAADGVHQPRRSPLSQVYGLVVRHGNDRCQRTAPKLRTPYRECSEGGPEQIGKRERRSA